MSLLGTLVASRPELQYKSSSELGLTSGIIADLSSFLKDNIACRIMWLKAEYPC